jgi:uncharacterized protein (DUF1501 family)
MNRRDFFRLTTLAAAGWQAPALWASGELGRVLVLLELNGGNDGLNTVIPYADPLYYRLRPNLAIAREQVLPLTETLGLHPALAPLQAAWEARELAIALGVGYPQPDRSHFRSIEIWETASDANQTLRQGWLARLFQAERLPAGLAAHGIVLGTSEGPLTGDAHTLVLREPQRFLRKAGQLTRPTATARNPALAHLLAVRQETRGGADALGERLARAPTLTTAFPATRLGRDLETAARLIVTGVPVPVIKLAHGSFDTHAQQRAVHERLLGELAAALAAFRAALTAHGRWRDVLVLTYSEFGRRAAENGSLGTDHGTAAPHFLLGDRVRGGLYGRQPSLARLADGDLVHSLDFRSLYRTVAQGHWGVSAAALGAVHPALDCLA